VKALSRSPLNVDPIGENAGFHRSVFDGPTFNNPLFGFGLLHPALERFYPPSRRIIIPERLTVYGGVMLADALDELVKALKRVSH
jgi:hypothetical protein